MIKYIIYTIMGFVALIIFFVKEIFYKRRICKLVEADGPSDSEFKKRYLQSINKKLNPVKIYFVSIFFFGFIILKHISYEMTTVFAAVVLLIPLCILIYMFAMLLLVVASIPTYFILERCGVEDKDVKDAFMCLNAPYITFIAIIFEFVV